MLTRRAFLAGGLAASFAPSLAARVRVRRDDRKRFPRSPGDTALVVVHLDGGNDGLNTVVPYDHPVYRRSRPTLALPEKGLLRLCPGLGLHPALAPLLPAFDAGQFAIVQGIGLATPDRSHFQSLAKWCAGTEELSSRSTGWLARAAADAALPGDRTLTYIGSRACPSALTGLRAQPTTISGLEDLALAVSATVPITADDDPELVQLAANATGVTLRRSEQIDAARRSPILVPGPRLAADLDAVARLLCVDAGPRIFWLEHAGQTAGDRSYDTHSNQIFEHAALLSELATALAAFRKALLDAGRFDRIVVLVFSEFGRRVAENGSRGTDHGTAGVAFVLGGRIQGGLKGAPPDLDHLDDGDPKVTTDFRRLYAAILGRHLGLRPDAVLGEPVAPLGI